MLHMMVRPKESITTTRQTPWLMLLLKGAHNTWTCRTHALQDRSFVNSTQHTMSHAPTDFTVCPTMHVYDADGVATLLWSGCRRRFADEIRTWRTISLATCFGHETKFDGCHVCPAHDTLADLLCPVNWIYFEQIWAHRTPNCTACYVCNQHAQQTNCLHSPRPENAYQPYAQSTDSACIW